MQTSEIVFRLRSWCSTGKSSCTHHSTEKQLWQISCLLILFAWTSSSAMWSFTTVSCKSFLSCQSTLRSHICIEKDLIVVRGRQWYESTQTAMVTAVLLKMDDHQMRAVAVVVQNQENASYLSIIVAQYWFRLEQEDIWPHLGLSHRCGRRQKLGKLNSWERLQTAAAGSTRVFHCSSVETMKYPFCRHPSTTNVWMQQRRYEMCIRQVWYIWLI